MFRFASTILLMLVRRFRRGGIIVNEHTLTKSQTRFHVAVLRRWFDFISIGELPGRAARPGRRPFCLLTFDDGKRSNFTEVAPELQRLHVPAVFYVTTNALTTGSCLWFDKHTRLIRAIGRCPAGLELGTLKQLPFDLLNERLDKACAQYGFDPEETDYEQRPMSWHEARGLSHRGFAIGAHGTTHAILTRENRKRAFAEIEQSLAKVTSEIGDACPSFAFPNGNYNTELTQFALLCGARSVMTTDPMWVDERARLWQLPRIQLFGDASRARIETKIALAAFKGTLRNPNGDGRQPQSSTINQHGSLMRQTPARRFCAS